MLDRKRNSHTAMKHELSSDPNKKSKTPLEGLLYWKVQKANCGVLIENYPKPDEVAPAYPRIFSYSILPKLTTLTPLELSTISAF